MSTDPRLENYLARLEKVLAPFAASDRAEILMEIKSHVLAALERSPDSQLDSVLKALGEPETVANRYLIERGLQHSKPPISPTVKWLVIGFLGTAAIAGFFLTVTILKFSPLVKVDDQKDYISLLGGAIEINGKEGTVRIFDSLFKDGEKGGVKFEGSHTLPDANSKFKFYFGNGKLALESADDGSFSWECRARSLPRDKEPITDREGVIFDLKSLLGVSCTLRSPRGAHLEVEGGNGKVEIEKPTYDIDLHLHNGDIELDPDDAETYQFSLSVDNGSVESFPSSKNGKGSHQIKVHLNNGRIERP